MNMENLPAINKLLERNNYQVVAYATDNGCVVVYPERVEPPQSDSMRVQYEYVDAGVRIIISDEDRIRKDLTIPCPHYAQRLMMFCHVIGRCLQINFTVALVKFVVGEEEYASEEVFTEACGSSYMNEADLELESKLRPVILDGIFRVFTAAHEASAKNEGVTEGYVAIRDLLLGPPPAEENNATKEEENTVDR